jgi:hypothetical protein
MMIYPRPVAPRSRWWPALIGSGCLLVLLMAAIGVVAAEKTGRHLAGPGAGASPSTLIDPCLVGTWQALREHQELRVEGYGSVGVDGKGVVVHVGPDGSVRQEYGSASPYTTTANGHRLQITIAGTVRGTIRTSGRRITFHGMSADGTVTATVDGTAVATLPLQTGGDPVDYDCAGSTLTETGTQDYSVTLTRIPT